MNVKNVSPNFKAYARVELKGRRPVPMYHYFNTNQIKSIEDYEENKGYQHGVGNGNRCKITTNGKEYIAKDGSRAIAEKIKEAEILEKQGKMYTLYLDLIPLS